MLAPWKKSYDQPKKHIKNRDITLTTNVHLVEAIVFPVVMYRCDELDCNESWVLKNWCFWTVVLKKTLESPLDGKEIQLVHPKGNHPWIFIRRAEAEGEDPILWPPDAKNWLMDAGQDWRQEKGRTEDEMFGWHHWLDGHEFEQSPWVGDGQILTPSVKNRLVSPPIRPTKSWAAPGAIPTLRVSPDMSLSCSGW